MVGVILTLVFGAVIFFLYNRLTMTEKKMGLFEGVLTDLKIMMDSAPFSTGPPACMHEQRPRDFEPTPEYLNAISGPVPLQKDEVEEVSAEEDYQQTLEEAMNGVSASESGYKTLQIDETGSNNGSANTGVLNVGPISVTKLSPDLDSMTVKELTALAKERSLVVPAGTRRKELIDILKKTNPIQGTLLASADLEGPEPPAGGESLETTV
jgi:hypothetical protein